MSEHPSTPESTAVAESTHAAPPPAPADFDPDQVSWFRKDDGAAMKVIGIGLVVFFFYSLLVMLGVSIWTFSTHAPPDSSGNHASGHAVEDDEEGYGKITD